MRRLVADKHSPEGARARQLTVGLAIYVVAAVVAAGVGYFYLQPPARRAVSFLIADAAAIKAGTEVRVAGVPAGTVETVRLGTDAVRVDLSVDDGIYLGDQTSVDVRMLTAVGGYYINLSSSGSVPLGGKMIPVERTHAPYSLTDLLADSATTARRVDAHQLGANLDSLAGALETNPGSVGTIVDGVKSVAQVVNHQQDQLRSILDASSELLHASIANGPVLVALVRQASILVSTLDTYKLGIAAAGMGLRKLFDNLIIATDFYGAHRDWLLDSLKRVNNALNVINTDIPRIIGNLGNFVNNVRGAVSPGGLRLVPELPVLATDMCVPISGRTC
ncbi:MULTISPECIES: MlaD family protein [unclassified Mycobacteroides]|uniref:MlaD family protein n=1 Tax=unclassified Mycobacteroides TaxID=2618759 RepID=UPI0013968B11|nr:MULTISPECIES: MlaD family protein [unclassified Mycobacteroides]